jgi:hypothetical protein
MLRRRFGGRRASRLALERVGPTRSLRLTRQDGSRHDIRPRSLPGAQRADEAFRATAAVGRASGKRRAARSGGVRGLPTGGGEMAQRHGSHGESVPTEPTGQLARDRDRHHACDRRDQGQRHLPRVDASGRARGCHRRRARHAGPVRAAHLRARSAADRSGGSLGHRQRM